MKSWDKLKSKEKTKRTIALEALRSLRNGEPLSSSAKRLGTTTNTIRKYLGKTIFKKNGRWSAKPYDRIQRSMTIYDSRKGRISIVVTNSKDATIIGEYFNAVKEVLKTGNEKLLKKFKKIKIKDSKGKIHRLETNPNKIYDIEDQKEDSEFFEIYEE